MNKVLRYFAIKDECLFMYSKLEGEFGSQLIVSSACTEDSTIHQQSQPGSAPLDFNFRLGEMQYFLQVYSMFNPQNKVDYGIQEEEPQTPEL